MSRSATLNGKHSASKQSTQANPAPGRKGLVIGASIAVVAIVAAIVAAQPRMRGAEPAALPGANTASVPAAAPALGARESQYSFGPISMAAGKVSHRYWVRNESGAPLHIGRIYTSCMCTTASFVKSARLVGTYGMPGHGPLPPVNETLAPDEAAYLDVVFDPAAHGPSGLGRTVRVVTIEHAAGKLELGFTANVEP